MNHDMEEIIKKFNRFMEEHEAEITDDESYRKLAEQFMTEYNNSLSSEDDSNEPTTVYDYLELASGANTKKKKLEYVQMARELEPENLDAALMEIELTEKHVEEHMAALQALIEKGNQQMEEAGYFDTNAGDFWLVVETRPYMRVRYAYLQFLLENGMIRSACAEGERMLALCENDNLGIRYTLMHIYAYMENEMAALALHKKYDSNDETQMLLPLTVLYYKMGNFQRAKTYLQSLRRVNKDTRKFFSAVVNDKLDDYLDQASPYGYRPFSMDELMYDYYSNQFLFARLSSFFKWGRHVS